MTKFYVITQPEQKYRRELEKIVRDEIKEMEADIEYDEYSYKSKSKYISCYVCKTVEKTDNPHAFISIPFECDGEDMGYIHIYGWQDQK